MKGIRQYKIKELITKNTIETQEELVDALRDAGLQVTQATVSRDMKELMLIKVPAGDGRYKYSLPQDQQRQNPINKLKRALIDHFTHIDFTENLVVMKCLPGTANAIGALIDNMEWPEVMGTICGDDTILIICRTKEKSGELVEKLLDLLN
ncbi:MULTISPECIES: transcriptional regulator ArgR [unclassified Paenibacillus]|uniref:transcriptional regulator AhrC/ArgR n=1 Tax=unclassified Paenibacillus TaxID=185978 RepID=UPI0001666BFF|nr:MULTISPECIES: transcriptional regulator ArgR [unclassified Paenibacillus]ACT00971.1 arginine repressor, ArgR [Paenibacillus sp. JDR-2]NIK67618.1 transcriptional regulator of arginine metabolism [Paenibacillus sp. BK720]TCN01659.1 ArgR family transcriptional regulator [Paenibacillus sp. BK033]